MKKKFKRTKSYKRLVKKDRKYFNKLLNHWYSKDFITVLFELTDDHHPLDLMTYIAKFSSTTSNEEILIKAFQPYIILEINKRKIRIPKVELNYLFHWIIRLWWPVTFRSKHLKNYQWKKLVLDLEKFFNGLSQTLLIQSWLIDELKYALDTKSRSHISEALSKFYLASYHQFESSIHNHNRLNYIVSKEVWEQIFSDWSEMEKMFYIYSIVIIGVIRFWWWLIININEIVELCNKDLKISITEADIMKFIEFYWFSSYSSFESEIFKLPLSDFFPKWISYNVCNLPIEINKFIIDISKNIGREDGYFIINVTRSITELLNRIISTSLKTWLDKSKFYELYCNILMKWWWKSKDSQLDISDYIFWSSWPIFIDKWVEFGDIDFYIYSKTDWTLLIFEIKDKDRLWQGIYKVDTLVNLTSRANEIPGRQAGRDWDVYKWVSQLDKFYRLDKEILAKKLKIGLIKDVGYIFLNTSDTFCWNSIMKPMLEWKFDIPSDKYNFMSLEEFEVILSVCFKEWVDFFKLINSKNIKKTSDYTFLDIVLWKVKSAEMLESGIVFNDIDSLYQDYSVYLYDKYKTEKWGWFFPDLGISFENTINRIFK